MECLTVVVQLLNTTITPDSTWIDFLNLLFSIISSIATIIAAIVACLGINAWKQQKKENLADDLLAAFYQFETVLNYVRSDLTYKSESDEREIEPGADEIEKDLKDRSYIVYKRFAEHKDLLEKMTFNLPPKKWTVS